MLEIITYHYVRNNEEYNYDCYARRKDEFKSQIDLFRKEGDIIDPSDIEKAEFYSSNESAKAFLITFDDGYKDHFYCAQYLSSHNSSGIFFPPVNSIEGNLLDVNLIHILLGTKGVNKQNILNEIVKHCKINSTELLLNNKKLKIDEYINKFENKDSYDLRINQLIKKILQRDIINSSEREELCKFLFKKFIGKNSKEEAINLYLSKKEMLQMKKLGMYFGSHGLNHLWLGYLSKKSQFHEIKKSFDYLIRNNFIYRKDPLIMCYPFGSYNNETLSILKELNVDYSVTTKLGSAFLNKDISRYELKRWDTNQCWDNDYRKPTLPNY